MPNQTFIATDAPLFTSKIAQGIWSIGKAFEGWTPAMSKLFEKVGTPLGIVLGATLFKWMAGDTTFYVGLGVITILIALYVYIKFR